MGKLLDRVFFGVKVVADGRPRRLRAVAIVPAALVAAISMSSSCATPAPSTIPQSPQSSAIWSAGDSISVGWSAYFSSVAVHHAGAGGEKFVDSGQASTVESLLVADLDSSATKPKVVVINGGANDYYESLPATIAAMQHLEATVVARGIRVVWLSEPYYAGDRQAFVTQVDQWVASRPGNINCNPQVLPLGSTDSVHPNDAGYRALAACAIAGVGTV